MFAAFFFVHITKMNSHPYLVVFDLFDSDESGLLTREKLLAMFYAVKHLDSVQVEPVKLHRGYTLNSGTTCLQDTSKPFESPVLQSSTDAEDVTLVDSLLLELGAADGLTKEQFVKWTLRNAALKPLILALDYVVSFVFGVRPQTFAGEDRVIRLRLKYEKKHMRYSDVGHALSRAWFELWEQHAANPSKLAIIGPIDNKPLLHSSFFDVFDKSTGFSRWSGRIRRDIDEKDFVVVSSAVYELFHFWYDGGPSLARPFNKETGKLELWPLNIKVMKPAPRTEGPAPPMVPPSEHKRDVIFAFNLDASRSQTLKEVNEAIRQHPMQNAKNKIDADALRIWDYSNPNAPRLLEDDTKTIEQLGIADSHQLLAEVRNADLTWPSELFMLAAKVRTSVHNGGISCSSSYSRAKLPTSRRRLSTWLHGSRAPLDSTTLVIRAI